MIYASILAGGVGARMHRMDLPKQYLLLGSKPILVHTLEQFAVHPAIDRLFVVAPDDWILYTEDLLKKWLPSVEAVVLGGGANKTESVAKVVAYIEAQWGVQAEDILLTHDAIRPFVTQRIIEENIAQARLYGAANTVMTTADTIVTSDDGVRIAEVPPKRCMYAEQTPQTFCIRLLQEVFAAAGAEAVRREYELSRLCRQPGREIYLVRGEYSNMKIINPYDLEVANALIKEMAK